MTTVQQSNTVCASNKHTCLWKPPSSFFSEDGYCQSLYKTTECSCCSTHTEAHMFISFPYRGSMFPLCPWCPWLLRDHRNCATASWGVEKKALEMKPFHNPLHSALSCPSLRCSSVTFSLMYPKDSLASVYSNVCLAFTNDIWVHVSRLKIMRACIPFWCYWKVSVRDCLWVLCFSKIFTNCSPQYTLAFERFTPVKTSNPSKSFLVASYPTKQHLCVLSQSFIGIRLHEKIVKPNSITSSLGVSWISGRQNLTPQSSVSIK